MVTVVVTRHKALAQYLREINLIEDDTKVIEHATPEDVRNQVVIGVLPLRLACLAYWVIEVPLDIPASLRGTELTIEQIRQYAGTPETYTVKRVG